MITGRFAMVVKIGSHDRVETNYLCVIFSQIIILPKIWRNIKL